MNTVYPHWPCQVTLAGLFFERSLNQHEKHTGSIGNDSVRLCTPDDTDTGGD